MIPQEPVLPPDTKPVDPAGLPADAREESAVDRIPSSTVETRLIPVIAEVLTVGKRVAETGTVRIMKTVLEEPKTINVSLLAEQVDIERVSLDQMVDQAPATRQEGDTTIYSVLREEYVIQKRLRLVEEIRVTKRRVSTTDTQTVTLRRESVAIERITADTHPERSGPPGESSL